MNHQILQKELKSKATSLRAQATMRFFKTGKGEYGEGDIFIGVSVPDIRLVAKKFSETPLTEIQKLLKSKIHEERLLGCILLVNRFKKASEPEQKIIVGLYLKHRKGINNWDLVDSSAPYILGEYCFKVGSHSEMDNLLNSKRHWDRRMAMLSTFAFIRKGDTKLAFQYALALIEDKEDLMHKAVGWMLREAGKREKNALKTFIKAHGKRMPRTMLRYSIEHFSDQERNIILNQTKRK